MATIAIITEYNPFHKGHERLIKRVREHFGSESEIIAIMSGNFVQRAEAAILDKYKRAEMAVRCGVDLVLELPFPYSSASAELFAKAGVSIANDLGCVDYLAFGSESGDAEELSRIASLMLTKEFEDILARLKLDEETVKAGYPALVEKAYLVLTGEDRKGDLFTSNNTLAIEYIKQLIKSGSNIKPFTVKREGADYNESSIIKDELQSATAIRGVALRDPVSAREYIPNSAKCVIDEAIKDGIFPSDTDELSSLVITDLNLNSSKAQIDIQDAAGGLYNRLRRHASLVTKISELLRLSETKKYTNARIRRALLFSYFGVTSSEVGSRPAYTQLLASNKIGFAILARIKKTTAISILTKPTDYSEKLSTEGCLSKELSDRADIVYGFASKRKRAPREMLSRTPYVKK